jgi:DNA-directed RNA polymerase subunit RPC12/RpoP
MNISFFCYRCGQSLAVDEAREGQLIECPKCGTRLEVPHKSDSLNKVGNSGSTKRSTPTGAFRPLAKGIAAAALVFMVLAAGFFAYKLRRNQPVEAFNSPVRRNKADKVTTTESGECEFSADVFIRSKSGESIKCSLVDIQVFEERGVKSVQLEILKALNSLAAELQSNLQSSTLRWKQASSSHYSRTF